MSLSERKRRGVVYTPPSIVALILDHALPADAGDLAAASVCDPACGAGAFLVAAARRILTQLHPADALPALQRMAGYDIDDAAIARCRQQLDDTLAQWRPGARVDWNLQVRNVFDQDAFAGDCGRFTHIVGNPPYVRVQHLEQAGRGRIAGQWQVVRGATDLFLVFYELGLNLLRSGGVLGYIAPSSWLRSHSGAALRQLLTQHHRVERIIDFGPHQVFDEVTTYTAITIIRKHGIRKDGRKDGAPPAIPVSRYDGARFYDGGSIMPDTANPAHLWTAATPAERQRMAELASRGPRLSEVADIHVGIQTLADRVFIMPAQDARRIGLEPCILRPIVKASVMRGGQDKLRRVVIFPYDDDGRLLPESCLSARAPVAYRWLQSHRERLLNRDKGRFDPARWYAFGRQVSIISGFGDKILTSSMNRQPNFQVCPDPKATFYGGYCVKPRPGVHRQRLLAALNSDDMDFYIRQTGRPYQGGWMSYAKSFIRDFPVPAAVQG